MRIDILMMGLLLFLGSSVVGLGGSSEENIIAPCVDGHGDINLEGIMCDKNIYYMFEFKQSSFEGSMISILIGGIIIIGFLTIILGFIMEAKKK